MSSINTTYISTFGGTKKKSTTYTHVPVYKGVLLKQYKNWQTTLKSRLYVLEIIITQSMATKGQI